MGGGSVECESPFAYEGEFGQRWARPSDFEKLLGGPCLSEPESNATTVAYIFGKLQQTWETGYKRNAYVSVFPTEEIQ